MICANLLFISNCALCGSKEYKGLANQYLILERVWKSSDKIKVSFQMHVQILSGGKSYSGQIAFQRGPQVLELDSLLNIEALKKIQFSSDQKLLAEKPSGKNHSVLLPTKWIGKQSYTVNIIDKNNSAIKQQLVLVPFANASQTGGAIKV